MTDETTSVSQDNTVDTDSSTVDTTVGTTSEVDTATVENQANEPVVEQSQGAPEQYTDFTVPENFSAPIDDFKTWAKENNMTQEVAQSAVDFYVTKVAPIQQAQHEAQVETWATESTTKYGKEGIESANKALGRFSTPEFTEFLQQTGLGNHPEMIGIFKEINSKISESSFVDSKTTPNATSRLYANSPELYK